MSKYINIILFSLFAILSIHLNIGLSLYIPFVCYYIYKNIKNVFLILPLTIFSIFMFDLNIIIEVVILFISLLIIIFFDKKKTIFKVLIYSIIINIITLFIYIKINDVNINVFQIILSLILCPIIYLFLFFNTLNNNNKKFHINDYIYNELILSVILILSTINYNIKDISISLLISIYFAMYFSSNKHNILSIIFSLLISLLLIYIKDISYTYLITITSLIYMIPSLISSIIFIIVLLFTFFVYKDLIVIDLYYYIGFIVILFELTRSLNINKNNKKEMMENTYTSALGFIDTEVEGFSLFLDKIQLNINNNNYNEAIGKSIETLTNNICINCDKRLECYKKNKGKLYYFFKNCLFDYNDNFICEHGEEMRRMGRRLNNELVSKKQYVNDLLTPMLSGISAILKQFLVDNHLNEEEDYMNFYDLKEGLMKHGYCVSMFSVSKVFKNDFLIEVGLIGITYMCEKETLEKIASFYIKTPSSVNFKEIKKNKTYIVIIPKNNYEITYGYGSVSKVGNNICGDNYLIKNLSNKRMMACICDGMGKGINANIISSNTLKLIDEITNLNITSTTSLQILNTLYYLQDYQDIYTTLDYIEIDKHTGEMIIYKAGAAITYIIHSDTTIEKIQIETLPFGLNELIVNESIKLNDNDLILMASDGIFDNIIDVVEFENFIKTLITIEPQKIAYEILNYTRHTDLISQDDMSIIVLKVKCV